MILGIDEVGRGCWAGPVCVAAVVLGDAKINGLNDSKKLSKKKRQSLALEIKQKAAGVGIGWASAGYIDHHGIVGGLIKAAKSAHAQVNADYDEIIIDGTSNFLAPVEATVLARADQLIPAVSAASIVAKVARDTYMASLDSVFPEYEFSKHVGYGTAIHQAALRANGPSRLHRMSFAPLRNLKLAAINDIELTSGRYAENMAANHLRGLGYEIIDRNWRTRWCEIDIIAVKDKVIYFVEVKYRKNSLQGGGLDYVTDTKKKQMRFAAEYWRVSNKQNSTDARLGAVEVSGSNFKITSFIDNIV